MLEAYCKMTGNIPRIVKGAGWSMALLIFQIRTSGFLLGAEELEHRLLPMLASAREGCQFMMEEFDHMLS